MQVTIVTPLFPPDVSTPALYAKTLAENLAGFASVEVIHYGYLPEAVNGVSFVSVPSRTITLFRLIRCLSALWRTRTSDYFIILNGPSVELPYLLLSQLMRKPCLYIVNDGEATTHGGFLAQSLRKNLSEIAVATITPPEPVLTRPLIHPLKPETQHHFAVYKQAWEEHIATIRHYAKF